ncbi:T9SS type A sorting domain-containing protein [Empedobacter tilapiae]
MKRNLLKFQVFILLLSVLTFSFSPRDNILYNSNVVDTETILNIPQNLNQLGLVVIKGNLIKKRTSNNVLLSIQYLDENNNWITKWSKILKSDDIINGNQEAFFELPPSKVESRKIKILFTSEGGTLLNDDVIWNKTISHYNYGDYSMNASCSIDENKYTILIAPKEENIVYASNGDVIGIKDKVNSKQIFNKKETLFTINKPATLITENGTRSIRIINNDNINDVLAQTPETNYKDTLGRPAPYLYSYVDPVYIFAGKFSVNGFKLKFSQWPGDVNGPGYHDFSNPSKLISRYFNLYNTIDQKLSEIIKDQEPVVFVSSKLTGFCVYKQDGSIINLTGYNNYNPAAAYFGYPPDHGGGARGPGSENFIISNTKDITLYGMGAIAYGNILGNKDKSISEINSEISAFIKYTGIFGQSSSCYTINPGAVPNYTDEVDKNILAAPNSYIYDVNLASTNNYGGIYIPVKKAYDVWQDKDGFINKTIPNLSQSASVVWQDKEGLINSVSIVGKGVNAKLKVEVNLTKGKGNAVVALHVGNNGNDSDPIYWSWHIWATDDPTNGITYANNGDARMVNTFMDRNLGALSNSFLDHDWNKSGGLMYQWGRKDPFPAMRYVDETLLKYYLKDNEEINNGNFASKLVKNRPYDVLTDNIKYSIQNPFYFINRTERAGAWFASSDNNKKEKGIDGYATENYDLWGDNNKGVTKKASFDKQIKSTYDPCPAGWRVPSFAHSESTIPNFSPWGSRNGYSIGDDHNAQEITESLNRYPNAKFYLRMGVNFERGSDNYNIGLYSLTGGYKRGVSGNVNYQDNYSESNIWSATLTSNVQGRNFHIINDPDQLGGRYLINPTQEGPTSEGAAVRCVKDEVTNLTFDTEYFNETKRNYTEGLDNPNSYILFSERSKEIPVTKAYAVYNQILTDKEWIPNGKQTANVYWTTNDNLIKSVEVTGLGEKAKINVKLNDNQYGNAVVSLHIGDQGNSNDPVYWSWHIWVPKSNPEINTVTYISDKSNSSNFKGFNTSYGFPPMKTEFMDRVLGAIDYYEPSQGTNISGDTYGMLYQWGRKDPLPGFYNVSWAGQYSIFKGNSLNGTTKYSKISNNDAYINLGYQKSNLQNTLSINEMKLYSIQNPLSYLANSNSGAGDWISNMSNIEKDRWGHASKKSINDPCPEGWRVPDYGFNINLNSPWAKASLHSKNDKGEFLFSSKLSDYMITKLSVRPQYPTIIKAFSYYNPNYTIGSLPATGNRRINRGVVNMFDFVYAASVWSASMIADYRGYTYGMDTYGDVHLSSNVVSPSQARNVVCSKDTPRFTKEYFENLDIVPQARNNVKQQINHNVKQEFDQVFYPNPVENILKTSSVEQLKVEIYSIAGDKILQGQFKNQELNISQLKSGIYVLVLENGKTYKIIKK